MADKKKKILDLDSEAEENLTEGQSTAPQNKVEKALIRGAKAEDIVKENEEEEDPERRTQTDLEIAKHVEKAKSMDDSEELPEAEQKKRSGWVRVNMYETITPAPHVGKFNVGAELGIRALEARKTYSLPKEVADVLIDARKAGRVD